MFVTHNLGLHFAVLTIIFITLLSDIQPLDTASQNVQDNCARSQDKFTV